MLSRHEEGKTKKANASIENIEYYINKYFVEKKSILDNLIPFRVYSDRARTRYYKFFFITIAKIYC